MYKVESGTAWSIVKGKDTVLEVTSEGYADFLCELMNKGASLQDIQSRSHPDMEYFDWCKKNNGEDYGDV